MKSNDNLLLLSDIRYLNIFKSIRFLQSQMVTKINCLASIDVVGAVNHKNIKIIDNFEQRRHWLIDTNQEESLVNEMSLLEILPQINHITEKNNF